METGSNSTRKSTRGRPKKVIDLTEDVTEVMVEATGSAVGNEMPAKRKASSNSDSSRKSKRGRRKAVVDSAEKDSELNELAAAEEESDDVAGGNLMLSKASPPERKRVTTNVPNDEDSEFVGGPILEEEAKQRWPHRYQKGTEKSNGVTRSITSQYESAGVLQAKKHYTAAKVDGLVYKLGDDAYVKAGEGEDNYICRIIEMFEAVDGVLYFTAQWYYRAKDTVIKGCDEFVDKQRVFFSEVKDENTIDCLVDKVNIHRIPSNDNSNSRDNIKADCDLYCDTMYLIPCSTFLNLPPDVTASSSESNSTISSEMDVAESAEAKEDSSEMTLLDMYSGCGAMSTGLCLGANSCGVNLVTKWAVDLNQYACESLRLNHPETNVRNEPAEDFLALLKEWEQLCVSCLLIKGNCSPHPHLNISDIDEEAEDENSEDDEGVDNGNGEVYEVEHILDVCYGDPNGIKKPGLYFKIHWKGYGADYDTWEPIDGLSDCPLKIKDFVVNGFKAKRFPLPGGVDVICGGPPCQGISGFNRFRNTKNPLQDPKNKQLKVFMDMVDFLRPRFVLMENVVDLLKFSNGFLGRYALSRLVGLNYQARLGMMAAGAYGLPQFRMRVFMWGALRGEKLPQYPLPTHNVVVRGVIPTEFELNTVAYDEGHDAKLKKELFLGDAIFDLPPVENNEKRDDMEYVDKPGSEFQQFIRLGRDGLLGTVLHDHRPLQLNDDDYQRVCHIPKAKGANFRDLPGVSVVDNKVQWDPNVERVYLSSGKPLVPDYAMSFVGGTSSKPFRRLWWDETVPTVVTRAEPHNQAILHPLQDRVLTIRENARLQGFPDYYKLCGPIKERYIQVGNAVAVPVARALGYSLALAFKGLSGLEPTIRLPEGYGEIAAALVDQMSPAEVSQ
ncbi:DNA (cytosine-5)-methyltransferase CMT3-like [Ipomoea triloba]|uniref:DNA (cytosine-5)-methyltransferase CMT3-like n=1 Tax=Ipomoea triloba TaxID=35885 RepID=UPI00125D3BDD|nr:DNA (cytosine-5)-methyltransferase CMT3-like [Ipomoea triloba]